MDIEKKICGVCHGRFELREDKNDEAVSSGACSSTISKPRPTPKFALFVKSHYSGAKENKPHASHREIMQTLGDQFKKLDFDE